MFWNLVLKHLLPNVFFETVVIVVSKLVKLNSFVDLRRTCIFISSIRGTQKERKKSQQCKWALVIFIHSNILCNIYTEITFSTTTANSVIEKDYPASFESIFIHNTSSQMTIKSFFSCCQHVKQLCLWVQYAVQAWGLNSFRKNKSIVSHCLNSFINPTKSLKEVPSLWVLACWYLFYLFWGFVLLYANSECLLFPWTKETILCSFPSMVTNWIVQTVQIVFLL